MVKRVIAVLIALGFLTLCLAGESHGQSKKTKDKPDFSGTWKLDRSQGNYAKISGLKSDADLILVISHSEPELKVTRKSVWNGQETVQESVFHSDDRDDSSVPCGISM